MFDFNEFNRLKNECEGYDIYPSHSSIKFGSIKLGSYESDKLDRTINHLGQLYKKTYGID